MTPTPDLKGAWKAKVITLFPGSFPGVLGESLTGKALQEGLWQLEPLQYPHLPKLQYPFHAKAKSQFY